MCAINVMYTETCLERPLPPETIRFDGPDIPGRLSYIAV